MWGHTLGCHIYPWTSNQKRLQQLRRCCLLATRCKNNIQSLLFVDYPLDSFTTTSDDEHTLANPPFRSIGTLEQQSSTSGIEPIR